LIFLILFFQQLQSNSLLRIEALKKYLFSSIDIESEVVEDKRKGRAIFEIDISIFNFTFSWPILAIISYCCRIFSFWVSFSFNPFERKLE